MSNEPLTARVSRAMRDIQLSPDVTEAELESPTVTTVFRAVWGSLRTFWHERPAIIVGSAFVARIQQAGDHAEALAAVKDLAAELAAGVRRSPATV